MSSMLSYPEIEAAPVYLDQRAWVKEILQYPPATTLVDLLEVGEKPHTTIFWEKGLDHDSLVKHIQDPALGGTIATPALRIFFLNAVTLKMNNPEISKGNKAVVRAQLHPSTINWLRDRFDVSGIFLDCVAFGTTTWNMGRGMFLKQDGTGNVVKIYGSYSFYGNRCQIWFSHNIKRNTSTYIVNGCPSDAKTVVLKCALESRNAASLVRIGAIDTCIADARGSGLGDEMITLCSKLFKYEQMEIGLEHLLPSEMSAAVQELHSISTRLHIISEHLVDLEELLEFLGALHGKYISCSPDTQEKEPVAESLGFLASRINMSRRWASNFINRTDIRINLFYNLASQRDNKTNLEIANFTSKIAVETQRDGSSMITIAAVTMFFLPGTFVSALFSMVFFNSGTDASGQAVITVSPKWWYFIAITIPLTIIVFLVWVLWQRWRNNMKGIGTTKTGSSYEKV